MIIYIHGFASAGQQNKWELLQSAFPDQPVLSPTLPVEPQAVISTLKKIIASADDLVLLVGTSLGGFYAWYLAAVLKLPAIIINPSTEPWKSLLPAVGMFKNLVTGEMFEWKEAYLHQLEMMSLEQQNISIDGRTLKFFVSTDDELLDHSRIREMIPSSSEITFYHNSAHRFTRFSEILPDIQKHYSVMKSL